MMRPVARFFGYNSKKGDFIPLRPYQYLFCDIYPPGFLFHSDVLRFALSKDGVEDLLINLNTPKFEFNQKYISYSGSTTPSLLEKFYRVFY